MNYIVFDLEWNQTPNGKGTEKKEMPFEIVEIGAVKLSQDMKEISRFSERVRPQVYKKFHRITEEILHISMEDLKSADVFPKVARRFLDWCGKDCQFATWGPMDLTELQKNFKYYHINPDFQRPLYYYDIQKVFSIQEMENTRTLKYAIDKMKIKTEEPFHQALSDAVYTAQIMGKLSKNLLEENFSVDYFQNPKNKKEEITVNYPKASLFVSREYETKEEAMQNKELRALPCICCGKRVNKKVHWFSDNSNHYYCLGYCLEDGYLVGKINLKKTLEGKVFGVKMISLAGKKEADRLRQKKETLREKRHEKKKK